MVGLTKALFAHKSNAVVFAIICSLIVVVTSSMSEPPGFDKFDKIRVNEKNFDKIKNLHVNWYAFSIKALMGQLGRELFKQLSKDEKRQLSDCLDDIDDTKDLVLAAKCLVATRTAYMKRKAVIQIERFLTSEISTSETQTKKNGSAVIAINTGIGDAKNSKDRNLLFSASGIEDSRRASRIELKSKTLQKADLLKNLQTKSGSARITPESKVKDEDYAKSDVIHTSNSLSQENVMWQKYLSKETVNPRFRRKIDDTYSSSPPKRPMFAYSRYQTRDHNGKVADENTWQVKQSDSVPTLSSISDKSPVARVAGLISNFAKDILPSPGHVPELVNDDGSKLKWSEMYNKLLKIKQQNDAKKNSPGAKVYDLRMYDLVLGHESPTVSAKKRFTPEGILQTGLNLIDQISGPERSKVRQGSNSKWLSPRFAPLMPDKTETDPSSVHLSPTLFALYETPENDATNIASVPKILKGTGMNKKDRETVIETLMDITGTTDHVNDALGLLSKGTDFLGINGEIFDANDRISAAYQKLENSFNVDQSNQIDNNGFAFLEEAQLTDLFRDQKADIPKEALRLHDYVQLSSVEEKVESLWKRIYRIAKNIPDEIAEKLERRRVTRNVHYRRFYHKKGRAKRQQSTGLSVLRPVVLTPFLFTPVYGITGSYLSLRRKDPGELAVLGPVVLSPFLFSPLILNPSVLSPYILSPAVGMPYILSPYVLTPYVLSPLVMAPLILTPYVLSPNILSPYIISPLILSPFVLSPDILSPELIGGTILSPNVASPNILSDSAIMADVLSPSFLS